MNKMKKLVNGVCSVVLLLLLFTITAYAHSGKTDSYGGHFDHSNGSYHYHHGYSAHSHYDMDGDGKLDCPYEFDDKTNHGNSSSNNASNSNADQTTDKHIVVTILGTIGISMVLVTVVVLLVKHN